MNQLLADVVAWSLHCASQRIYPSRGFYGESFEANTYRSTLCGKQIAGGFKLLDRNIFPLCISFVCIGLGFIQPQTKLVIGTLSRVKVAVHDFQGRLESPVAVP